MFYSFTGCTFVRQFPVLQFPPPEISLSVIFLSYKFSAPVTSSWFQCTLENWLTFIYNVSQKNTPWNFLTLYPKRLGIFSPNFTHLLYVPIYTGIQSFIQLSATLTKLCHIIKRDHHNVLKMSTIDRNAIGDVSHLIWHNFVTVGNNWIEFAIKFAF